MGIAYNSSIVRDGLVLHLDAPNTKSYPGSGTVWSDLSGNNNHTTLNNGPTYSTDYFYFDGVNDRANTPTLNGFSVSSWNDPFTLEASVYIPTGADWHYTVDGGNSGTAIIGRGGYAGSIGLARQDAQKLTAWIRTDGGIYQAQFTADFDTWYVLTGVYNGSVLSLSVNGEFASASTVQSKAGIPDGGGFSIGGNVAFGGRNGGYGEGRISFIRVYSRALTSTEIRQNFEALRGRYGI